MGYKHQTQSYRIKDNILYICWSDYPTKSMADNQVNYFKRYGLKVFKENNREYYRVFIEALESKKRGLI